MKPGMTRWKGESLKVNVLPAVSMPLVQSAVKLAHVLGTADEYRSSLMASGAAPLMDTLNSTAVQCSGACCGFARPVAETATLGAGGREAPPKLPS
jgi:hypothetical protein